MHFEDDDVNLPIAFSQCCHDRKTEDLLGELSIKNWRQKSQKERVSSCDVSLFCLLISTSFSQSDEDSLRRTSHLLKRRS